MISFPKVAKTTHFLTFHDILCNTDVQPGYIAPLRRFHPGRRPSAVNRIVQSALRQYPFVQPLPIACRMPKHSFLHRPYPAQAGELPAHCRANFTPCASAVSYAATSSRVAHCRVKPTIEDLPGSICAGSLRRDPVSNMRPPRYARIVMTMPCTLPRHLFGQIKHTTLNRSRKCSPLPPNNFQ